MNDPVALAVLQELGRRGMSVAALSERSGVHRSVLGRWLNGQQDPRLSTVLLVMRALGWTWPGLEDVDGQAFQDLALVSRRDWTTGRPRPARRSQR